MTLDIWKLAEGIQALDDGGGYGEWVDIDWTMKNQ